jgi:carbonic anhydrase
MKKLLEGIVRFKEEDFQSHKDLFRDLGRRQNPHTLFIGCCDSRVVPNLITSSMPGDLFVVRNIANIVPEYREPGESATTISAIEYAVIVLKVKTIVICGHSNCGGCAAIYDTPEQNPELKHTKVWLSQLDAVKEIVETEYHPQTPEEREWITEQTNVLHQMKNLLSYPFVSALYEKGQLEITGMHYIIETGEVFRYSKESGCFELVRT